VLQGILHRVVRETALRNGWLRGRQSLRYRVRAAVTVLPGGNVSPHGREERRVGISKVIPERDSSNRVKTDQRLGVIDLRLREKNRGTGGEGRVARVRIGQIIAVHERVAR